MVSATVIRNIVYIIVYDYGENPNNCHITYYYLEIRPRYLCSRRVLCARDSRYRRPFDDRSVHRGILLDDLALLEVSGLDHLL